MGREPNTNNRWLWSTFYEYRNICQSLRSKSEPSAGVPASDAHPDGSDRPDNDER